MTTKASEGASAMAKQRWARIPKNERSQHVPRSGGPPRRYPQCPVKKYHRFNALGLCKCGQKRLT